MKNSRKFASLNIVRRADLDFTDDGTRFHGYEYKGVPVTYTKADSRMYFAVRPDYLTGLTYADYCNEDWYKYCDTFNGVEEINEKELIPLLEAIVKGIAEVRERINNSEVDFVAFEQRKMEEIKLIDEEINKVRNNFNWLDAESWRVNNIRSNVKALRDYKERLENMHCENTPAIRAHLHTFNTHGYILLNEKSWYISEIERSFTIS